MAIGTIGTNASTSLKSLPAWAASLLAADVGAMGESMASDAQIAAPLGGVGATAVLATGTTHTNTTLDTLVTSAGAPLAQIKVGDRVISFGDIPLGTFVAAILSPTSVQLSQAATGGHATQYVAFVRPGVPMISLGSAQLVIPRGRGILKVLPGDYVAIDNCGFPYLIPAASVTYAGSVWTKS